MANSTIGYVASSCGKKPTEGIWEDERGNTVTPKVGMLIDRELNDYGYQENLASMRLVAVPLPGNPNLLHIITQ